MNPNPYGYEIDQAPSAQSLHRKMESPEPALQRARPGLDVA